MNIRGIGVYPQFLWSLCCSVFFSVLCSVYHCLFALFRSAIVLCILRFTASDSTSWYRHDIRVARGEQRHDIRVARGEQK